MAIALYSQDGVTVRFMAFMVLGRVVEVVILRDVEEVVVKMRRWYWEVVVGGENLLEVE